MDDQDSRKRSIDGRRFELWCLPDTRRNECRGRVQIRRLDRGRRRCSGDCRGAPAARRSQGSSRDPPSSWLRPILLKHQLHSHLEFDSLLKFSFLFFFRLRIFGLSFSLEKIVSFLFISTAFILHKNLILHGKHEMTFYNLGAPPWCIVICFGFV